LSDDAAVVLRAERASLTVLPADGGRASSLVVDGLELLAHHDDTPTGWGWFPMAPWPGRLAGNAVTWDGRSHPMPLTHHQWAIHGRVYQAPWRVRAADTAAVELGIELGTADGDPWPWPCQVRARWQLTGTSLVTELEVASHGADFPAELGWHPWFRKVLDVGGPAELDLPSTSMLVRGEDYLPTGQRATRGPGPYDDTFDLPGGEVGIHWPGALDLRCRTDCAYVVVFDEKPDALCVEPQTGPPDWINRAPGVVSVGHPRVARATWTWSSPFSTAAGALGA
jgi:aldose 1-epimerase